ncbi:MAG: GDYXXLXY domain-containing protein [Enterobacteriaceae bacterium]
MNKIATLLHNLNSRWTLLAFIAALLAGYNYSIVAKERLIATGQEVILQLQPLDPRSLMQGDYVELRFAAAEDINKDLAAHGLAPKVEAWQKSAPRKLPKGLAVFTLRDGYHHFVRMDDGSPLQKSEVLLEYKQRHNRIVFGGGSFFVQEGTGRAVETEAKFARLRVDAQGKGIITDLLDKNRQPVTVASIQ